MLTVLLFILPESFNIYKISVSAIESPNFIVLYRENVEAIRLVITGIFMGTLSTLSTLTNQQTEWAEQGKPMICVDQNFSLTLLAIFILM
ncbi:hypothetical protein CEXT_376831 [Caerostris extrusa]|uniref:Uncharacterized protein n=1 Tax=Caerostris extrusa TaxID=172846 RepID=A0AAV4MLJ8_CAEEX|nr:hypothetical protein CEXT_376831 [Caerostris extrusa]